jgi:serine protease Do
MNRRFTLVTLSLTATTTFLIGLIVAGSLTPTPAGSASVSPASTRPEIRSAPSGTVTASALVNFADVAEHINPAVVNVDATSRTPAGRRSRPVPPRAPEFDFFDRPGDREPDVPRRGAGSGFLIDRDGHILTNHHVIENADRIAVKLADGRTVKATLVGADQPTDIALIKIPGGTLPVAPLGDSDELRVGEWVCAIGNPLAYEHTVTVGVVSYIGRKLFNASLDRYIQTDAAINFGNSGGPLINTRGEVIGINSAISWRASNIGFAIPINQATAILPQLKEHGRVVRGYMGVTLKEVDPDLRESLKIGPVEGALVQDVAAGSPGARAGLRPYDLILSVDGRVVTSNDELIGEISARPPGTVARVRLLRNGQEQTVAVRLTERPGASLARVAPPENRRRPASGPAPAGGALGLSVRDLDRSTARRLGIPEDVAGVLVSRVDPMSAAFDAAIERGFVIMDINRQRVDSVVSYRRIVDAARPGDVLALYLYAPSAGERTLRTLRVEGN